MKKKLLAIIAILCASAFVLAACGGGGGTAGGGTAGSGSAAPAGGGDTPQAAAETFDVGTFTVAVPNGWTAFPQSDLFADKDADGNYPADPDAIVIAKGATDEFSALTAPSVRIYYSSPETTVMDMKDMYEDVKDIEGVKINGVDCPAYSGDSLGYVYQMITYNTDTGRYDISILVSSDGKDNGIKWDDPDVMTIMESITKK